MSGEGLAPEGLRFRRLVGVGGIGTGIFFALEGDHDLGRNESRPARLLDVRDYCKLHIVSHYPAVLLGARPGGEPFHVLPMGAVGDDEPGRRLRAEMTAAGMDTQFVRTVGDAPTLFSACFQYPDGSGGNITTSDSAASRLGPDEVEAARPFLGKNAIALALPEVPLPARRHLLRLGGEAGALRVAAFATAEVPAAIEGGLLAEADLVALNQDEAGVLVGRRFDPADADDFLARCREVLPSLGSGMKVLVTAGPRGAFAFEGSSWTHVPAHPVRVVSTAGAGDALLGGVLAGLAAGLPLVSPRGAADERALRTLSSALDLGVLLAAYKVTSPHTIPPELSAAALASFASGLGVAFDAGFRRRVLEPAVGGPGR